MKCHMESHRKLKEFKVELQAVMMIFLSKLQMTTLSLLLKISKIHVEINIFQVRVNF